MSGDGRTIVVSGASGFIGTALCRHLLAQGQRVRALLRDPENADLPGVEVLPCRLPDELPEQAFQDAQVFVHCAWDTRFRAPERARAVNVEGSRRLFALGRRQQGLKIVFLSSLSAHADAVSLYGRTKLEVEALLDPSRDLVLRPGHVIGEGGVFWRTAGSIARLPFIPLFFGGRQMIQTVALDDLCQAVSLGLSRELAGVLQVAEVEPVSLRDFYGSVAHALGKTPRFLRLPGRPTLLALRLAERLGFSLPVSSDNLAGLKRLRAFDLADDMERLGLQPRTMRESLARIDWRSLT